MKLVISDPKTGKSYQTEIGEDKTAFLIDKKIGETVEGTFVNADGYELQITGGSDGSGFPMRKDIYSGRKVKAFLSGGVGFRPKRQGERRKKMVRGNSVSDEIVQVNLKVVKAGGKSLEELFGKKEVKEEKKE